MKKWLCGLLLLALMLPGCAKEEPMENPVRFYYCRSEIVYFDSTGAVGSEQREAGNRIGDKVYLLNRYLQGPEDEKLTATFPEGAAVRTLEIAGEAVKIVLSEEFAQLTGMELSLACACLTLTACELTGAKKAEISVGTALLDGSSSIIMVYDQLVLEDLCRVPVEPN